MNTVKWRQESWRGLIKLLSFLLFSRGQQVRAAGARFSEGTKKPRWFMFRSEAGAGGLNASLLECMDQGCWKTLHSEKRMRGSVCRAIILVCSSTLVHSRVRRVVQTTLINPGIKKLIPGTTASSSDLEKPEEAGFLALVHILYGKYGSPLSGSAVYHVSMS